MTISVITAIAILNISLATWKSIPAKDRKRILDALTKGHIARAKQIKKSALKKVKALKKPKKRKKKRKRKKRK